MSRVIVDGLMFTAAVGVGFALFDFDSFICGMLVASVILGMDLFVYSNRTKCNRLHWYNIEPSEN